jgi:hypothetical protein
MPARAISWPRYYYAATIAFALLDWLGGMNLRAAGFAGSPGLRVVYYAGCLGCGLLAHLRPGLAGPVTLAESALNIVALILSVLLPLYTFDPEAPEAQLSEYPEVVANFLISGSAATAAFYHSLHGMRTGGRAD